MTSESIANGHHYKLREITVHDYGRKINTQLLTDKMELNNFQSELVRILLAGNATADEGMILSKHFGFTVDPFFVATHLIRMDFIEATIFKKIARFGKGDKSEAQDRLDIIGACKSGIELLPDSAGKFRAIKAYLEIGMIDVVTMRDKSFTPRVHKMQDSDGHWYWVPFGLVEAFNSLDNESLILLDSFRTMGHPDNVPAVFSRLYGPNASGEDKVNEVGSRDSSENRIKELELVIRETIEDNLHLADGENCTLIKLKRAIGYE